MGSPYLVNQPCIIRCKGENYQRPKLPIDSWSNRSVNRRMQETSEDKQTPLKLSSKPAKAEALMKKLTSKSSPASEPEDKQIINDVSEMMETVVADLSTKYTMFQNSRLLRTGSIFEGVKLNVPDEFDFMIDLPSLGELAKVKEERSALEKNFHWFTIDLSDTKVFSDLFPKSHRVIVKRSKYCPLVRNAWYRRIYDVIGDSMKEALATGWKMQPANEMEKWTLDNGKVYTYNLWWDGPGRYSNLHVSIDIVLTIPLRSATEFITESSNSACSGRLEVSSTGRDRNSDNCHHCQIRVIFIQPGIYQARMTTSVIEAAILNDPQNQDAKQVLRIAKLLALHCIGQYLERKTHRFTCRLPTYWIKTVWFYLLAKYPNENWKGLENQQARLIEIFSIIHECLYCNWMSSFFLPGYNVMRIRSESSMPLGFTSSNHTSELYDGLRFCSDTILTERAFPRFVVNDKELINLRMRVLFFHVGRQRNVWDQNLDTDQELCLQDSGRWDAVTFEAVLQGYISSYFPKRFALRQEDQVWCLYEGRRKVDISADYDDICKGKYFVGTHESSSLAKLENIFSTAASLFKRH